AFIYINIFCSHFCIGSIFFTNCVRELFVYFLVELFTDNFIYIPIIFKVVFCIHIFNELTYHLFGVLLNIIIFITFYIYTIHITGIRGVFFSFDFFNIGFTFILYLLFLLFQIIIITC